MYSILSILNLNNAKGKLHAFTRKEIQKLLSSNGEVWNERTIYNYLKELENKNYIGIGFKRSNAKTFYIRPEGIAWMEEIQEEENCTG